MQKSVSEIIIEGNSRGKLTVKNGKVRKIKPHEMELHFSKEELITFLLVNNIRTIRKLTEVRRKDIDPNFCHYRAEFKKWSNALIAAFGLEYEKPPSNPEYIIKLMIQFDVFKIEKYLQLWKNYPKIFPSYRRMRKAFGSFSLAVFAARQHSLIFMAEAFLNLKRRLGRMPKIEECKKDNVDITRLKRLFGSKKKMEKYMKKLDDLALKDFPLEKEKE